MLRVLIFLLLVSPLLAQNGPSKIGNLTKAEFEKWIKPLTLDGHKFAGFDHEEDSFQAGFLKGESAISINVRLDDGKTKEDMMKMANYKSYDKKGLKHYYLDMGGMKTIMVVLPKLKVLFGIGGFGSFGREQLDKMLDQIKIYDK